MSFFGQQASSGGLFGATTSTSQPAKPAFSLGQPPAANGGNAAKGGLFGASTSTTGAPATGGLFGNTTSQAQQTGGGLFGKTQAQQTGGLFGASQSQPANSTTTGGLFSGLGGVASTQPTSQPALGASLFSGLGQTQQGPSQQQAGSSDPNASTTRSSTNLQAAYFDQILERGRKRNGQESGMTSLGDLPSLQLGLGDIARKVRNLGQGGGAATTGRPNDSRAHYLLAASGVSTSATLRDLNNLNAQAGAAIAPPSNVVPDSDPETFVSNLQTQSTLELIQQGLEQSKSDFDAFLEENVQMNWDAQRLRIYEHFGLAKPSIAEDEGSGADTLGVSQRERGAFGRSSRRSRPLGASQSGMSFGPNGATRSVLGRSALRGSTNASAFSDVPDRGMKSPSGATLAAGLDDRLQRDKQEKYAQKIFSNDGSSSLNSERNRDNCYPVLHQFAEVEQAAGIDHTAMLVNSYEALISITGEPAETKSSSNPAAIKERAFAKQYLDESPTSPDSVLMRKRILNGSRKCLEKIYLRKVEDAVDKDRKAAQVGGMPTRAGTVRGYVRVLDSRKELGDTSFLSNIVSSDGINDYCWVILYVLLRCGLIEEAADYVQVNMTAMRTVDRKFPVYLQDYARSPDRQLSREHRNSINTEYSQSTRTAADGTFDPYRAACYKIVGRCELSKRVLDNIRTDEEDWVWLQFALAREVARSEEQAGEVFGLEQIRDTVADIGKRHFSQASDNPGGFGLFFFMQILAGNFEKAVSWLYPQNHVSAVHFAIALDYYGLLRVSDLSTSDLLSYTTRQQARLNFAMMVGYYTSEFRAARPAPAADYLCLLNLNSDLPGDAGVVQAKLCWEALRELVLETREFAALLGDLRHDGTRIPGAIQHRAKLIQLKDDFLAGKRRPQDGQFDSKKFMDELTIQSALAADESGRTTDAVLLYHLAGEYDSVISIINRTLSEALTTPIDADPITLDAVKPASDAAASSQGTFSLATVSNPFELANNFWDLYRSNAVLTRHVKEPTRDACETLLRLAHAKQLLRESLSAPSGSLPFSPTLESINSARLLPLQASGDMTVIRTMAQNFNRQPPVVARTAGDVILWAMCAIRGERTRLAKTAYEDAARRGLDAELEQAGRDLMVFAGLVKFRLSPRVFEVLAREGGEAY